MVLNENAKKWVAALRSGNYEQGRGALCREGKYCCLGVACVVAIENGLEVTAVKELSDREIVLYDKQFSFPPTSVQKWLGLYTKCGSDSVDLVVANDNDGLSFSEIADLIEANQSDLFKEVANGTE